MSYLKYKAGHGSAYDVWHYLFFGKKGEKKIDRVVDFDARNIIDWSRPYKEIDKENKVANRQNDSNNRTYYHWIIAPSPDDFVGITEEEGLAKVKALTEAFIDKYASEQQVFSVYHDDAACKNIHSHIVFGAKNLRTGKQFRFSDADYQRMKDFVNSKSKEFGLSAKLELETHQQEVKAEFDRLNDRRENKGEEKAKRSDKSKTQTLQVKFMTDGEYHRMRLNHTSWKDVIRQHADRALLAASSFEEYQKYLAQVGIEVYQNKYKQCIYVIYDERGRTKGKVKGEKLGKFYQTDFLATQYMDLKFTKAFWAAHKGEYSYIKQSNSRLINIDSDVIDKSMQVYEAHGVVTDADAKSRISAYFNLIAKYREEKATLEKDMRKCEQLIDDLEYVQGLNQSDKQSNSEYEKRRKRLVRAKVDFSCNVYDLKQRRDSLRQTLEQTNHDIEATEEYAQTLIKAYTSLQGLKSRYEKESKKEQARYKNRITKRDSYYRRSTTYNTPQKRKKRTPAKLSKSTPIIDKQSRTQGEAASKRKDPNQKI